MEIILNLPESIQLSGDYIVLKPNITESEFWEIANEDTNFELIDGVLVIHSPASTEHEQIFHQLSQIFAILLEEPKHGQVFGSRLVMRLSPKWNVEPDLMILSPQNYQRITPTRIEGPADLVFEILSDSTREIDLTKKIPYYLNNGVKEVWIIDPKFESIEIHNSTNIRTYSKTQDEDWVSSTIIPQIRIKGKWVWNRTEYPAIKIIRQILT
jgi:Uma2 family endonuclease